MKNTSFVIFTIVLPCILLTNKNINDIIQQKTYVSIFTKQSKNNRKGKKVSYETMSKITMIVLELQKMLVSSSCTIKQKNTVVTITKKDNNLFEVCFADSPEPQLLDISEVEKLLYKLHY